MGLAMEFQRRMVGEDGILGQLGSNQVGINWTVLWRSSQRHWSKKPPAYPKDAPGLGVIGQERVLRPFAQIPLAARNASNSL